MNRYEKGDKERERFLFWRIHVTREKNEAVSVGNRGKLNKTLPWVPEAWQTEILALLRQPMRKTGTEHFHSSLSLNFDLFYCITFKPITANISHYNHMDLHMKATKFA